MRLKGNVAIISGGGSGMGAETARFLAKAGIKVALLDMNIDAANKVAAEVNGIAIECNVIEEKNVEAAVQQVASKIGPARICINCAGIAPAARMVGREGPMPLADFKKVIDVNLIGTFNLMKFAAAAMVKLEPQGSDNERGVIINTASVAAYEGQIGQTAYSASKGGIVAMTLPAARELAQFGVRVMTIAPGLINTPMVSGLKEEARKSLADSIPFPKRLGEASEYAQLVGQIIENPYLNGSVIRLDGALRMPPK